MEGETTAITIAAITIIVTIIGTGIALASTINPSIRDLRREVGSLGRTVANLGERVARIEGILQFHGMNGTRLVKGATDSMPRELAERKKRDG